MISRPAQSFLLSHRRAVVAGVLLLGTLLSLAAWRLMHETEERRIEATFRRRAAVQVRLARERLQLHTELVRGLRAYIENSDSVNAEEFAAYTRLLAERLPAARAFQWAPRIPHAHRADFEAAGRARVPDFRVWERDVAGQLGTPAVAARERAEYWPISLVNPVAGNEAAFGFDLHESIVTRPMLDHARRNRVMTLSPQVRLIRTAEQERGAGIIFIEPVFRPGHPLAGPDGFFGFIQAIFQVDRLLGQVHTETPDEAVDLAYYDDSAQFDHLKLLYARIDGREFSGSGDYATSALEAPPELKHPRDAGESFRLGDRDWRLVLAPNPRWEAAQRTAYPWLTLGAGLFLTGLSALFAHVVLSRTERVEGQIALRTAELEESRRQLASLLADMPGAAYRCGAAPPFRILFVSEGIEKLCGYAPEAFISARMNWNDLIHPDELAGVIRSLTDAVTRREPFEIEYRLRHRDGTWRHVWERGRGVTGADGGVEFIEGLTVDATSRKEAEARAREFDRQLLETQKLESLGVLAGGIAHDFNNLLTAMLGQATLARMQLPPGEALHGPLQQIELAARRAADLCAQMLAYAGKGNLSPGRVDLSSLVRDTTALLEVSVGKGTRLHLHLPTHLPAVEADATQIRQIVMNLVLNAAEAIGDRSGAITVSTFTRTFTADEFRRAVQQPELPAGRYVGLQVQDNGGGIPPETLARIFEPFFTTKFSGRGLGLSAVLGIVRAHRGALFVESQPGAGSTFRLLLPALTEQAPRVEDSAPAPARAADSAASPSKPLTVLVVDDEEQVREITRLVLTRSGLHVLAAADGIEGLALCREHGENIDVILLDLTMPNLSGEETLRRLRMQGGNQRVILISGYSENDATRRCRQLGAVAFVQKPFAFPALLAEIRRVAALRDLSRVAQ